jgi:lipase chaperone LimK
MSLNAFDKRKQILKFRYKILQAEQERINGEQTLSIEEAKTQLKKYRDNQLSK